MNIKSLSGADLARCFGVDRSMVTRWKKAGMPETKGVFSLPECIKWRLEREADAMTPKAGVSDEGEKWLTAFRRERARMARLERLARQGELISKPEVIEEWSMRASELKKSLLAAPVRLSPVLEGKSQGEMRAVLKEFVYELLMAYCRAGRFTPLEEIKIGA